MDPSNFTNADRPTVGEVEAAARELHAWGREHGWWPQKIPSIDEFDPIARAEFEAIVEQVLIAAAVAKRSVT